MNFQLKKGEIIGIVGNNGAGKSTLLKILSEVITPSSGTVECNGSILSILEIGTGFHQDLSGYENIFFNASLLGYNKKQTEKIIDEIIDFSGIRHFIHQPIKTYSSGMYLRLAFSIALHINFDIILLDEVIAVGDAEFRIKALSKLKELIKQGKTCIIISHDLPSIMHLCDKCLILEFGNLLFNGPVEKAIELYLDKVDNAMQAKEVRITEHPKCRFINCAFSKESYFMDESIQLRVQFEKKCEEDVDIVLKVKSYDAVILSDCEIYRPNYKQKNLDCGIYETTCTIPANLLAAGSYKVDLLFGDKVAVLLNLSSIAKFNVKLPQWEVDKKWNEEHEGIPFRPICEWQTKQMNVIAND